MKLILSQERIINSLTDLFVHLVIMLAGYGAIKLMNLQLNMNIYLVAIILDVVVYLCVLSTHLFSSCNLYIVINKKERVINIKRKRCQNVSFDNIILVTFYMTGPIVDSRTKWMPWDGLYRTELTLKDDSKLVISSLVATAEDIGEIINDSEKIKIKRRLLVPI